MWTFACSHFQHSTGIKVWKIDFLSKVYFFFHWLGNRYFHNNHTKILFLNIFVFGVPPGYHSLNIIWTLHYISSWWGGKGSIRDAPNPVHNVGYWLFFHLWLFLIYKLYFNKAIYKCLRWIFGWIQLSYSIDVSLIILVSLKSGN